MLVHSNLLTGVRVVKQEYEKVGNNTTYTRNNTTEIYNDLALIDDSPQNFKGKLISDYGIDIGQVFIVYIDGQTDISRLDLPKLEIQWNTDYLHQSTNFDENKNIFSCKIIDINTPQGLILSHTELLVVSNF